MYLVRCADNSLYCGVTIDVERRVKEHNHPNKGAKYTRFRQPSLLVYSEGPFTKEEAYQREAKIKSISKSKKEDLIKSSEDKVW